MKLPKCKVCTKVGTCSFSRRSRCGEGSVASGKEPVLGVYERKLRLLLSAIVFLLPLVILFLILITSKVLNVGDSIAVLMVFIGMGCSFFFTRYLDRHINVFIMAQRRDN